jgi:predicted transcriptional regulator
MAKPPKAQQPKKTVSIRVAEELRYKADLYATKHRRSLRAVVDEAIEEYLKKRGA